MKKNIMLIVISITLGVSVCEFGLRKLGYYPLTKSTSEQNRTMQSEVEPSKRWALDEEVLGWINRPGVYQSTEVGSSQMTFTKNSERLTVAPNNEFAAKQRVDWLLVGCSYTQGFSVPDSSTYASFLSARFPDARIHNFGTGGYGTFQSLLVAEKVFREQVIQPKQMIYGFIGDHLPRNVATLDWVKAINSLSNGMFVHPHATMNRDGKIIRHPRSIENEWPLETKLSIVGFFRRSLIALRLTGREPQEVGVTNALIKEMSVLAKANNTKFLVAILDDPKDGVTSFLKANNIEYVMCTNPEGKIPASHRVAGVGHPNQLQHQLWANCIGEWIEHAPPRWSTSLSKMGT